MANNFLKITDSEQFTNSRVEILDKALHRANLRDVVVLESVLSRF